MFQRWLTYFLLTLIAMQSVTVSADMHQNHQSGTKHFNFDVEHNHQQTSRSHDGIYLESKVESINKNHMDQLDCHHCCHCHGTVTPALIKFFSFFVPAMKVLAHSNYRHRNPSTSLTTFYRPPKV